MNFICCYVAQSGLSTEEKYTFYERAFSILASVPGEVMVVIGDFNGYADEHSAGFEDIHEGSGYGMRNQDRLPGFNLTGYDS